MSEPLAQLIQKSRGVPVEEHFFTFYRLNLPRCLKKKASEVGFEKIELRFYEGADIVTYFPTVLKLPAILYAKVVSRISFLPIFKGIIIGRMVK